MSTLTGSKVVGLERIQRQAFLILYENLNPAIAAQESAWEELDEELATVIGETPEPTTVELIQPTNFYLGHRPSLIKAPINKYPNVSVMCDRADPSNFSGQMDHSAAFNDRLAVEVMCRSEKDEGEVNRRIQRTMEAVHQVLVEHRDLDGEVQEIPDTPRVFISSVFPRQEKTSYGNEWFWQGARLEYTVQKESPLGIQSNGSIFGAADIDQS